MVDTDERTAAGNFKGGCCKRGIGVLKMEKIMINKKMRRLVITIALLFCTVSVSAGVIFVDDDSIAPLPDGSSWELAFTDLQDAITAAISGDDICGWLLEHMFPVL